VSLLNQRGTYSYNHGRCFGDERPSAAAGSRRWSTPAAGGAIGDGQRRGAEGPTSSKLGPTRAVR
jgi:hypothetical protein